MVFRLEHVGQQEIAMTRCDDVLNNAKNFTIAAGATFGAAPIAVLVAIGLNGGFFTAPGAPVPMVIAGAAAIAAGTLLKKAWDALQDWVRSGCMSRECEGKLSNIQNALAAAITTVGLLAAACFAVAAVAWIPWFTQPAMWAVYIPMIFAAGSLGLLAAFWTPLNECQERIGSARGPLMVGEKASDPWFLRLKPKEEPSYSMRVKSTFLNDDASHTQWLECSLFAVQEWQVGAVAFILGMPTSTVIFTWTFAGKSVPTSSIASSPNESTLTLKSPPLVTPVILAVNASDSTGFKRSLQIELSLPDQQLSCRLILHFVPPMYTPPTGPPGPVEITPEMANFLSSIRTAMENSRPNVTAPSANQRIL